MLSRLLISSLFLITANGVANAQEAAQQSAATNFILIDYGFNLSADGDETDTLTLGMAGDDNGETQMLLDDGIIDDTSGFIGVGIGHRYENNLGAVLRYETGEMDSGSMTVQIAEGSTITAASVQPITTEVDAFMLEGLYFAPYSEQIEVWGLIGIGQSEVTTGIGTATISDGGEDTTFTALCPRSEDNTATRFGAGATYYLSQTHGFYAGVTISNYGDGSFSMADENNDDACTDTPDTLSIKDIEATDLRIGFFRSF